MLLLRSVLAPVLLVTSVVLSYGAAMGLSAVVLWWPGRLSRSETDKDLSGPLERSDRRRRTGLSGIR